MSGEKNMVEVKSSENGSESIELAHGEVYETSGNEYLDFINNFDSDAHPEEVTGKGLVKKLDKAFMVPMLLVYTLQFLDKVVLNYANVMGMSADLKLVGNQFSALPTYFFVAYIVAEFFQGLYVIPKYPVAGVLGINVILWGIMTTCCAAPSSFGGMLAVRILLGLSEAAVIPCLAVLTSNFYSRAEGTFRIGIWYSGLGLGQIIGGLISYLFQLVGPGASIAGWRIMFIVVGIFNIIIGVYVYFMIPSTPLKAKFLTQREKYEILLKLTEEKTGASNQKLNPKQIVELVCDIQAWLLLVISATISFSSSTISSFSAVDILSFGFTSRQAALLNMPSGIVSIVSSSFSTYFIMKGTPRYLAISLLLLPAVCGGALMSFLPSSNQAGLLIGIYMINTVTAPLAICYSWATANFAGSTKKAGSTSIFISIGFALGNILGPQSYRAEDAPQYYPAKVSMLVTQAVSIVFAFLIAGIYYMRNKRRDKEQGSKVGEIEHEVEDVWKDLTDFQNRSFRYKY